MGAGHITQIPPEFCNSDKNMKWYHGVFGIASSPHTSNLKAPQIRSSPFLSETGWPWPERQDRNYSLDPFLFVWEPVIIREDCNETPPILLIRPTPSWTVGFPCCLQTSPKWLRHTSPPLRAQLRCFRRRKKPHKMWRWGNLPHTDPTWVPGSDWLKLWGMWLRMSSRDLLGLSSLKSTWLKTVDFFFLSCSSGAQRRMLWCLGHQHPTELVSDSKPSVGGDCRRSYRCLHPCRTPTEKFFFSNTCVEPVSSRWCYKRVILQQDPRYPNCSPLQVLDANSSVLAELPALAASLPSGVWMGADPAW